MQYQTIEGWGHGGGILGGCGGPFYMLDSSIANPVNYQMLDYLIDDLGLTGSRTWEVGPRIDGTGMDNGDCDSIDWSKFQSNTLDPGMANYLVYFKDRILAEGYQPSFYSSPGYPTHATDQKPWIMFHPGERAQQIWASALYMKNTYDIDINYDVIYNEPYGNITSTILADDIKALGPRATSQGLATKSQYAEAVAPENDWNFITPVENDSELWQYVGRLSYHNYGTADPYRAYIRDFGISKGITTAQTEMANPTFDDLYNDLTLGGVSYWEVAYSSSNTLVPNTGLTSFTPSNTFFRLHQLLHYVRPGAIRIDATTNDAMLHVLSFSSNGEITTVIENTNASSTTIHLTGIPAGDYGMSQSLPGGTLFTEFGIHTVGAGDTITITASGGTAVTTLYPYSGSNHAPDIMTFSSNPGYLVLPTSNASLTSSASDAEIDALTYLWTVWSQPAGANAIIASPASASTNVSGLTFAGTYVFNIDVSDGINSSSKKVFLVVYPVDPPPVLGTTGFRIAAPYGLVFGLPTDTTHANIELPTSSVILQAGIADITGFSGTGTWSLLSEPGGANTLIDSTIYIFVSLRANATNMTEPGDYVFQINVTNPGYADLTAVIKCTVHPASSAPVINSIIPSPAILTLPTSTTLLTAVTSDPENDLLRHWWVVKTIPAGAHPVFDHQGRGVTNVSGLTVAGTYIFTLRCFDDLHETTQDVTVLVSEGTGIKNISSNDEGVEIYPNPVSDELNVQLLNCTDEFSILTISNSLGQVVMGKKTMSDQSGAISICTESLPVGIYFLKIQVNEKSVVEKFIKDN